MGAHVGFDKRCAAESDGVTDRRFERGCVGDVLGEQEVWLEDLRTEPLLLPSLDSDIRVAFDRVLELAGIRPTILAEVDDMAMLRLLAREREGVTLVPPIVVRDELEARILVEHCRIPEVTERFYAIVQKRRFPNQLLGDLVPTVMK